VTDAPRVYANDPEGEFIAEVPVYFFLMVFQALRRNDTAGDKALKAMGLSLVSWRALLIIDQMQPCTMNDLARVSAVDRTTLTRTVDQLVAEGLAVRATPPEDRRQVRISLTETGVRTLDDGKRVFYATQHKAVEGIDPARLREAARVLQAVVVNLVDDPAAVARVIGLPAHPAEPG
jgi:DNA-binding MarR family transcriptional regulator